MEITVEKVNREDRIVRRRDSERLSVEKVELLSEAAAAEGQCVVGGRRRTGWCRNLSSCIF